MRKKDINRKERETGRKKKVTNRKMRGTAILTFTALYLLSMGLMTWLVQESYAAEFQSDAAAVAEQIKQNAESGIISLQEMGMAEDEERVTDSLYAAIGRGLAGWNSRYHLLSAGIYDSEGRLAAKSCSLLVAAIYGENGNEYERTFNLDEYMAEDDLNTLAEYWTAPDSGIGMNFYLTRNGEDLRLIAVMKNYESLTEPGEYATKTEWYWQNPDIQTGDTSDRIAVNHWRTALFLPGAAQRQEDPGTDLWRQWKEKQEKDPFPEKIRSGYQENGDFAVYAEEQKLAETGAQRMIWIPHPENESGNAVGDGDLAEKELSEFGTYYTLFVRSNAHPWLATMDYLKYVYLGSLLFAAACAVILIIAMERTYRQRAQMEEHRRDFTNAMAHEMKTPLSVIRGFAENLLDNPDTEKRDYYLQQMISQTEEMDGLVKEMIRISRLDSEKLVIKKEQVSLRKILEDETSGLAEQAEHIRVLCSYESDIFLEGDRELLTLAFRNLLSNAAAYNRPDGEIRICLTGEKCVIENTGDNISPEDLPHVCEMFYTGNRSRSREKYSEEKKTAGERHFGLGLYLAERILQLHGMKLQIENIADGVRVTVRRGL